ncbi:hypothetical protein NA56DRAFT_733159 [Hyaloscypha hepaticicola]|uniref:HTH CENPB-type domain-containing protein n=1 Tax=Hyaloscypha hepaticicola TaxID=2082293 RepID=A0A2J6QJ69_9HELO|nr:hypothetical protein NA56DRAFT_733159 [Hyaloscypha hepaticicola]
MHTPILITSPPSKFDKMINEEDMEKAINELNTQLLPNYRQVSEKYSLTRITLIRRFLGLCTSRQKTTSLHHKLLTDTQEEALINQINKLTIRGIPPTTHIVKNLTEEIIGRYIYKNWTAHFVKRYSDRLKSLYLHNIDNLHIKSEYRPYIKHFFDLLIKAINDYNIIAGNIYNWDEKGFLIGLAHTLKRIMTKKLYNSGRIISAAQDGSREFISLLASICADGTALPPALIYKGASGDLQDTWLEDLNEK